MALPLRLASRQISLGRVGALLLMWALTVITLYPLAWLLLSSLKTAYEMFDGAWRLPEAWQWGNYAAAWNFGLGHYMINSVLVTAVSIVLILLLGAFTAFILTVCDFRGKLAIYVFVMGGMILPPEVSLFPLFRVLTVLGLYNTYGAMIVPYVAFGLPFAVFFLRAYMTMIPRDMHEAATLDGATLLRSFWSIYLPMSRPALAAVAVIQGMKVWNEFMFALTFIESDRLRTLTIGISTFGDAMRVDWAVLMAGLVISIVPVLAVFLLMQRHFVGGLTQGAVK
jgi:raffinose/stachyose/melibiose transport system permease protein